MKYTNLDYIISAYDCFLIDIWGVLHDGNKIYKDADRFLQELKNQGKHIYLLSNMPRRASLASTMLEIFGIQSNLYDDIVTSGEFFYSQLSDNSSLRKSIGSNVFFLQNEQYLKHPQLIDSCNMVKSLGLNQCMSIESASSIVALSLSQKGYKRDMELLVTSADKGLPLFCLNPDKNFVNQDGNEYVCSGSIAEYYKNQLGGQVYYFGKPHQEIYDYILNIISHKHGIIQKDKILAIGDGLYTDIEGANNMNIDSMLILDGNLKKHLGHLTDRQEIGKIYYNTGR